MPEPFFHFPGISISRNLFTANLMQWHTAHNTREMPWKGEKDPYRIWLSEVILQQTRVAQGWKYYESFTRSYPTIRDLAAAPDQEVFKLWEGLGYYNRCRNLLFTARYIVNERGGIFPDRHDDLLALKGVGPYTAAAIASFAYGLPFAVVDGNVFRVLSRFFGIGEPIDSVKGKQLFTALAAKALDKKNSAAYNQAIMDFGAVICRPVAPACGACPLQKNCIAWKEGKVNTLPVKEKTLQRRNRWLYYFVFEHEGKILVRQRTAKDIWQQLYEFYLMETDSAIRLGEPEIHVFLKEQLKIDQASVMHISGQAAQQLTHQEVRGQFVRILLHKLPVFPPEYRWQPAGRLRELAFPRLITQYLEKPFLQKSLF